MQGLQKCLMEGNLEIHYTPKASTIDDHVRIGLITKQCSLFYLISEKAIHLLYFLDNRQDAIFK